MLLRIYSAFTTKTSGTVVWEIRDKCADTIKNKLIRGKRNQLNYYLTKSKKVKKLQKQWVTLNILHKEPEKCMKQLEDVLSHTF